MKSILHCFAVHSIMALTVSLLVSCTATPVKEARLSAPHEMSQASDAKPIQFKKIVMKLKRGAHIGSTQVGLLCIPSGELTWRGGRVTINDDEFTETFRDELTKANYPVVGNPDALFEDPSEWKAELLVAGLIKDIKASFCYPFAGFNDWSSSKGDAYVKVDWQIYDRLDRKVVYEVTTEGSYKTDTSAKENNATIMINAFAGATQNLLADSGFHNLVVAQRQNTSSPVSSKIGITTIKPFTGDLQENINNLRPGMITVIAGPGHGNGFFVNADGYLLTNEHVMHSAKFLKMRLVTGREILGEVVRTDSARDIALVRVEETQMVALPFRDGDLNIGDDVYALGSPLQEKKFSSTLTKGIVSAFREKDGNRFIQSDVQILPGNSGGPLLDRDGSVVGIAVSGMTFRGGMAGLNFFIPIHDALKKIGIENGRIERLDVPPKPPTKAACRDIGHGMLACG